ncbi:hypothetical protein LVD15_14250 [Fulvivirga maritima]|uniref:hypothetical protein n=1 Tax=Fulvivirga maritima TaxID=2904247 RepID=UPI001F16FD24|nr:hypothetical protein [Fulvivirga maritima]UII24484.1 hypothetical protein LVD15_14250 [Fulvivirga maritima]
MKLEWNEETKKIIELAVIIYLACGIMLYYYKRPEYVSADMLEEVEGILLNAPKLHDDDNRLTFKLIGDTRRFSIAFCNSESLDLNVLKALKARDFVRFKVLSSEHRSVMSFWLEKYRAFSLKNQEGQELMTLDAYNSCKKNDWKRIAFVVVLLMVILLYQVFDYKFSKPIVDRNKGDESS